MILDILPFDLSKMTSDEYAGPCPWCGGEDRFRAWPDTGRYWCRQCGRKGDEIQFLRDFSGFSYREACEYLKIRLKAHSGDHRPPQTPKPWTPKPAKPGPGDQWQEMAARVVAWAEKQLWKNETVLDWLRTERGLTDKTIRAARLGWNPSDLWRERAAFGLPEEISKKTGKPKKMWMPAGLVIPFMVDDKVIRVRFRRSEPGDGDRYILLSGSDTRAMAWGFDQKTIVIVESELDGLLVNQAAGDVVSVVAMGSAQARPDADLDRILRSADLLLNSLDADEAGAKEAWNFWIDEYRAKRWPCIHGKDPGEMFKSDVDVRVWVLAAFPEPLSGNQEPPAMSSAIEPMLECLHGEPCPHLYFDGRNRCKATGETVFSMAKCPAGKWGPAIHFDMEGNIQR